jgi:hypothetical protein
MGERERIIIEGVNSNMIYCKNFCKCHNVHPPSTTKINKIKNNSIYYLFTMNQALCYANKAVMNERDIFTTGEGGR